MINICIIFRVFSFGALFLHNFIDTKNNSRKYELFHQL